MTTTPKRTRERKRAPLWLQIESVLRHKIAVGEYRLGDALPAESTLAASFNVSRVTVREAIRGLATDGIVQQIQGKGTFVIGGARREPDQAVLTAFVGNASFNEAFPGRSQSPDYQKPNSRHVDIQSVPMPPDARAILNSDDDNILQIERIIADPSGPYVYVLDFIPHSIGDLISIGDLSSDWLTQVLNKQLDNRIAEARQTIEATLADAILAEKLDIPIGSPILHGARVYYDIDGGPIYLAKVWHRADRFRYSATFHFPTEKDESKDGHARNGTGPDGHDTP
jgi:GntR family transcriptional regulator